MWSAVPVALLCMSLLDEDEAGQRARRGRSPIEHRGTFVHPSVRPSVRLSVCPSQCSSFRARLSENENLHHIALGSKYDEKKIDGEFLPIQI